MPKGIYKHIPHNGTFKKGHKNWNQGKQLSEETKRKIGLANSISQKGKHLTNKTRNKISQNSAKIWLGKKFTTEHKLKLRSSHLGHKHTQAQKNKIGKANSLAKKGVPNLYIRGSNHPNWKGGVTPINTKIRQSLEMKIWRRAVFERDSYQCIWGGKEHGSKLNADHIKPFSQYPELHFAIDNGRTLCVSCHKKTDTYAGRGSKRK